MIFMETQIHYKDKKVKNPGAKHLIPDPASKNALHDWDEMIRGLNKLMGRESDPENRISVYFCGGDPECLEAVIAYRGKETCPEDCLDLIRTTLSKNYAVRDISFTDVKEISTKRFSFLGEKADENGFIRRWHFEKSNLGIDYFSNRQFQVEEYLEEQDYPSLNDAEKAGADIMADVSLLEELQRMYSSDNEKKYYGNPVHYRLCVSDPKAAMDIVNLMIPALIANKRLCGRRILKIHNITEGCYDEEELVHLFESAQGNSVVIEMCGTDEDHGNYASAYQRVVDYFNFVISKYHLNTLCFFVELKDRTGFTDSLISKVVENIQIIKINEGYGDRRQAKTYLKNLCAEASFEITGNELELALGDKKMFSVEEICRIFNKWFKDGLRTHIYKAYREYNFSSEAPVEKSSAPYDDLQKMIGLTEIKQVIDQIIDTGKIQKLRTGMGLPVAKSSLHMIFTGNPGSAKTTVARLIAQILRKEDILDGGNIVECGRADLIARYVGWTAKNVRAKFREAKGGILFIDEAYSLVDDSHSFADEAINTIVQEMENHREDVIVILAGYPEKMNEFLDKNEGLKSRIAFHLDFPDYTPEELVEILKLMAEQRGYKLEPAAVKKCRGIFNQVCGENDFGNGRFVRNLLEQAEMSQSHRIATNTRGIKITKKALATLTAGDFDVNVSKKLKTTHIPIGFAV